MAHNLNLYIDFLLEKCELNHIVYNTIYINELQLMFPSIVTVETVLLLKQIDTF